MKLSVMQENLARGLSVVSRAVSSRSTLPVLANVLLRTEDAGLKLTATNLEIGITYWVPGKIETDGATTVPARLLTDLVGSLPASEKVDLELQGLDTLHLRCGRFATHVKGIDADEFPTIQTAGERPTTRYRRRCSSRPWRRSCSRPRATRPGRSSPASWPSSKAVGSPSPPPTTTGSPYGRSMCSMPSNPRRSSSRRGRSTSSPGSSPTSTIPSRSVLASGRNQVLFHLDGDRPRVAASSTASSRTTSRSCRRPMRRAPSSGPRGAPPGRPTGGAHRPASRPTSSSSRSAATRAGITVSANAEVGDHVGQVEAAVEGDGTTIAFNARYLADVLTNVAADQFALELNGPLSPGVFKPIGDDALRPRGHAGPDDLLRKRRPRPDSRGRTAPTSGPDRLDLRGYATLDALVRARRPASSGAPTPPGRRACSRRSSCWAGVARIGPPPTAS